MKQYIISAFILLTVMTHNEGRRFPKDIEIVYDPDMFRNVTTLISSKGYPVEDHTVLTADGFLLSMQRIPHGKNDKFKRDQKRPAIYLQHGLLSVASDWVLNFPEQSLGFILADAGYDVWLGNTRGNTYSRRHLKYTPKMKEFWDFSFDEMGKYDLPAMIDYVLNTTGQDQLYYIGHSQGTTAAFALLSESKEYNKKIKLFVALAPVAWVGHMTSVIRYLVPFTADLDFLAELLGVNELFPSSALMKILIKIVCDTEERFLCEDLMFLICGEDKAQLNLTRLGVYAEQANGGSSTKSVIHFAQMVNSKKFVKFDYGKQNIKHYNQTTPPEYDVSRITAPVALVWSMNDALADPLDVDLLQGQLKSMISSYLVPFPLFNHVDFVLAVDAHKLVYNKVISLLAHF